MDKRPQVALAYRENPNSICLSVQKLFKKQWRMFLKKSDISYLGLTKSSCIDRKKYEDKEKALILFH